MPRAQSPWPISYGIWMVAAAAAVWYRHGTGAAGAAGGGIVIDGAVFPPTLSKGSLVGGGTRTKYGVAKVYAVALYIDSAAAGGVLKRFASSKPPKDGKFFQTLIDGAFPKTLYLQMLRSVASDTMATALQESLGKRLSADSVAKFRAGLLKALPSDSIAKGAKLFFQCKGGAMTISESSPNGGVTLKDKALCPALFDVYYGKSPVSPAAKEGAANGFANRKFYRDD